MIRAILFDAFGTLFDVYAVGVRAEQLFPGQGMALATLWRDKQIEYSRLVTMSDPHREGGSRHYLPFWALTERALRYAAKRLGLRLDRDGEASLMAEYACLPAYPENLDVLRALRRQGLPLGILSNGNREMIDIAVKSAGMTGLFDHLLSVDAVRLFKTAPEAYQLGPDAFGLPARQILFVSSNAWDALCAGWFGYTVCWINRQGLPFEELDAAPTHTASSLQGVLEAVNRENKSLKEPT